MNYLLVRFAAMLSFAFLLSACSSSQVQPVVTEEVFFSGPSNGASAMIVCRNANNTASLELFAFTPRTHIGIPGPSNRSVCLNGSLRFGSTDFIEAVSGRGSRNGYSAVSFACIDGNKKPLITTIGSVAISSEYANQIFCTP